MGQAAAVIDQVLHLTKMQCLAYLYWTIGAMYPIPDFKRSPVDPLLDPHSRDVIEAAGLLEISEFNLMAMAYHEWYGRPADQKTLERYFCPYMFGSPPPFWAHRLAKEVLELDDRGELLASRFAVNPPRKANRKDLFSAVTQIMLMIVVVTLLFYDML